MHLFCFLPSLLITTPALEVLETFLNIYTCTTYEPRSCEPFLATSGKRKQYVELKGHVEPAVLSHMYHFHIICIRCYHLDHDRLHTYMLPVENCAIMITRNMMMLMMIRSSGIIRRKAREKQPMIMLCSKYNLMHVY